MRILIKLVITAVAVWVATILLRHHGITLGGHGLHKILTLIAVAIIFGLINAVLKPIIKAIGCWAYALTFGLIAIVVNGLLFWLTSWVAGKLHLHFHVHGIVAAVLGGLIVGVVSWILTLIVDRD
jgi:putative membrane protein